MLLNRQRPPIPVDDANGSRTLCRSHALHTWSARAAGNRWGRVTSGNSTPARKCRRDSGAMGTICWIRNEQEGQLTSIRRNPAVFSGLFAWDFQSLATIWLYDLDLTGGEVAVLDPT